VKSWATSEWGRREWDRVAHVELPPDIADLWGGNDEDLYTARALIDAWGLEAFRRSQLHRQAIEERKLRARKLAARGNL